MGLSIRILIDSPIILDDNQPKSEHQTIQIVEKETDILPSNSFYHIVVNNLIVVHILVFSFVILSVPVPIILFYNGYVLGNAMMWAYHFAGMDIVTILSFTAPHGLTEILAFILAGNLSWSILKTFYLYVDKKMLIKKRTVLDWIKSYIVVVSLIVFSAFIEAYITIDLIVKTYD